MPKEYYLLHHRNHNQPYQHGLSIVSMNGRQFIYYAGLNEVRDNLPHLGENFMTFRVRVNGGHLSLHTPDHLSAWGGSFRSNLFAGDDYRIKNYLMPVDDLPALVVSSAMLNPKELVKAFGINVAALTQEERSALV